MLQTHKVQEVDHWPLSRLTPYAKNARTHSPEEIAALAKSIDEFGLGSQIVVRDGTIAKGHRTSAACALLYAAGKLVYPVPGKSAGAIPFESGHVPIIDATGWSDAQFRAFVLADNRHALSGGWDDGILAFELDELRDAEFDLSTIGFASGELNDLIWTPNTGPLDTSPQLTEGFKFSVIVAAGNEQEQARLLGRFEAEGLTCRLLITQ